jgi:hypothetical protein
MVDSSWDNSGQPVEKKKMGTGMKVLLGCGIALLLILVTCGVGGAILGNMIKKDPKAFEARVEGFAKGLVQKDWTRMRALVDQLQTDEGAKALYQANPGLRQAHPSEDQFLQAVRAWRPRLAPLPEEAPVRKHGRRHRHRQEEEPTQEDSTETGARKDLRVDIQKVFGTTTIRCRYPDGARFSAVFDSEQIRSLEME